MSRFSLCRLGALSILCTVLVRVIETLSGHLLALPLASRSGISGAVMLVRSTLYGFLRWCPDISQ